VTDYTGTLLSQQRYHPYGQIRGTTAGGTTNILPTGRTYTGQQQDIGLEGIMYYGARMYDPMIGRFLLPTPSFPTQVILKRSIDTAIRMATP
jgi:RHS repeat-associated protein